MSKINHGRFARRKVHEPTVPVEFQSPRRPEPSKASLREQAAQAVTDFKRPADRGAVISPSRPPVHVPTSPSTIVRDITIECQCGHKAVLHRAPADLIGRRLRCSQCGEETAPF